MELKRRTTGQYYGVEKKETRNEGILLSEYEYVADGTDWHYHENPYFMVLLRGHVKDINNKRTYLCEPGTVLFQNWDEPHRNTKHSPTAKGFHLELDSHWVQSLDLSFELIKGNNILQDPRVNSLFTQLYLETHFDDCITQESVKTLVVELISELGQNRGNQIMEPPTWVGRINEMVQELATEKLTLALVSTELGIHPVYLCREFSRHFKISFGDYIRRTKLSKALSLLANEDYTIAEVAYLCGFADQSHFTRSFKRYFLITPNHYKRLLSK